MKVCLIVEGAYPYVNGGSIKLDAGLMLAMPDVEFVVQSIAASPDANLQFKYQIPSMSVRFRRSIFLTTIT